MLLGHETLFVTTRSEWHNFSCHSSTLWSRKWGASSCIIVVATYTLHSVVDVSDESDIPVISDEHATAWEALYVPSIHTREDPNQAPTEVAPSTHVHTRRGGAFNT